jgi:hypothetical protein
MNKFRKLGFITYNGKIHVNSSLLNAVLHDKPSLRRDDWSRTGAANNKFLCRSYLISARTPSSSMMGRRRPVPGKESGEGQGDIRLAMGVD